MNNAAALLIGYLLGSILPAYFIGRSRGVDLRETGSGNAGATNALHVLGPGPGIITGLCDVPKGVVAMAIAWGLGASTPFVFGAGIATVVGHRFPFYLRFRGAEGVGPSVGMLLVSLAYAVYRGWLPWPDIALLAALVPIVWFVFRSGDICGVAGLPLVYAVVASYSTLPEFTAFLGAVAGYIWLMNLLHVITLHLLHVSPETRAALGRFRATSAKRP